MRELRAGDRVSGYGDGVGVLTDVGSLPAYGGDCRVAWEQGVGIAGLKLGARLDQLTRIPKHRAEGEAN